MKVAKDELKAISARMGRDATLIQATGGNTSIKDGGLLWVKASGKNLANALVEEIFVQLKLNEVIHESKNYGSESNLQPLGDSPLRPSIETSLHALMPHQVVLHSHSIDVIALTLVQEAQARIKECLQGITWHWIPYCRPGRPLAKAISAVLEQGAFDVLILENHGLVVGGQSPEAAMNLQSEVIRRLKQPSRLNEKHINIPELMAMTKHISGARLPIAPVIHSLATDRWSFKLAQYNPYCPDHVVFCGVRPWVKSATNPVPGPNDDYGLLPGTGVILLEKATLATEAMLQAQAEVLQGMGANWLAKSPKDCYHLVLEWSQLN
jgi:rhamnose utilization protein RhaD (predicted bifunctional aldolase and dehydrogenase)